MRARALIAAATALLAGFATLGVVHRQHPGRPYREVQRERLFNQLWNDMTPSEQAGLLKVIERERDLRPLPSDIEP